MSDPLFYDDPPRHRLPLSSRDDDRNGSTIKLVAAGVAVIAVIVSIWAFYPGGSEKNEPLPIIRADSSPVRIAPDEPGGMDIANRDSTIYDTFNNEGERPEQVENLLAENPPSEELVSRDDLFAGLRPDMSDDAPPKKPETLIIRADKNAVPPQDNAIDITERPTLNAEAMKKAEAVAPEPPQEELAEAPKKLSLEDAARKTQEQFAEKNKTVAAVPVNKVEAAEVPPVAAAMPVDEEPSSMAAPDPEVVASAPVVKEVAPAAPVEETKGVEKTEPAAGAAANANFYIQLASIQDSAKTDAAWSDLKAKYSGLNGLSMRAQSADIPGKGTFHRIQAGPLSKQRAEELCAEIKAKSGGCLTVAK